MAPYPPQTGTTASLCDRKSPPACWAFAEPSSGLEPETPSLPFWEWGNRSQSTATVFACFSRFRRRPICDLLPAVATAGLHKRSILGCLFWLRTGAREAIACGPSAFRLSGDLPAPTGGITSRTPVCARSPDRCCGSGGTGSRDRGVASPRRAGRSSGRRPPAPPPCRRRR